MLQLSLLLVSSGFQTVLAGNVYTVTGSASTSGGEMPGHLKKMVPAIRSAIGAANTAAKFTSGKTPTVKFSASSVDSRILDTNNFVECNIRVSCLSDRLLHFMEEHQCVVVSKSARFRAIHAKVPISFIEELAKDEEVVIIKDVKPVVFHKANTSEGDVGHKSASARSTYGVTGNGVKVGVMSDSEKYLSSVKNTGDLPSDIQILASGLGASHDTGEGTAMMEIVHDLAPGASLAFSAANSASGNSLGNQTEEEAAERLIAMFQAGCKILCDDVGFGSELAFSEGPFTEAIRDITSQGGICFTSAGNSGNIDVDAAPGIRMENVWEGDWNQSGSTVKINGQTWELHQFPDGNDYNMLKYLSTTDGCGFQLEWSDPPENSSNDYELGILWIESDGTKQIQVPSVVVDGHTNPQTGTGCAPVEYFSIENVNQFFADAWPALVILKKSGAAARRLRLQADSQCVYFENYTSGHIVGHSGCESAISVAGSAAPSGRAFNSSDGAVYYSSDGPMRVFHKWDGTPYTSGNYLSTGGELRNKPDVTAATEVSCATPGFERFGGTSASAPHAAAIAALMLEANPGLDRDGVFEIMKIATYNGSNASWNRTTGYGILNAEECVRLAKESNLAATPTIPAAPSPYVDGTTLKWSAVAGANYYKVYRATNPYAEPVEYSGWQSGTSKSIVKPSSEGTAYFWFVKSASAQDDKTASGFSETKVVTGDSNYTLLPYSSAHTHTTYNEKTEFHLYPSTSSISATPYSGKLTLTSTITFTKSAGSGITAKINGTDVANSPAIGNGGLYMGSASFAISAASNTSTTPRSCLFHSNATAPSGYSASDGQAFGKHYIEWYGRPHYIYQAGITSMSIGQTSQSVPADGGTYSVSVTATPSTASWTASVNRDWVHLFRVSSNGSGVLGYYVEPNDGSARSATITVAGKTLSISQTAGESAITRPDNDNYANAASIAGAAGFANGSNENATREANEPYVYNQKGTNTVWWAWTAPATGVAVFDTNGSSFDTVMAAYAKTSSVSSLGSKLDSNDDDNSQGGSYRQSKITFDTASGSQYRIVVASYGTVCGSVKLNWQQYVKVSFNGNGATSGAMSVQTNKYNTATTLPSCGFSRSDGYEFDGWATSAGGSVVYAPGASPKFTSNTTLYAHWTAAPATTCSISFISNGGSGTMANQVVTKNSSAKLNKCTFTKSGYSFKQWSGSDGKTYQDQQSVTLSSDLALTAQWTGNVYRVTLNRQDGSGGSTYADATYGAAMPTITTPTRANYNFGGYFTGTDGSGTKYYNADGTSARAWDRTGATTLYAKWIELDVEYTIENGVLTKVAMNGCDTAEIPIGVTKIGSGAFKGASSLKTVVIPSSVTVIGYEAFRGCDNLKDIRFPSKLDTIAMSAFAGCESLTQIVIPSGIKFIAQTAFSGCSSLGSVTLPESTVEIVGWAFQHCTSLTNIVFSSNLQIIGVDAFLMCNQKLFDQHWKTMGVDVVNGWIVGADDNLTGDINAVDVVGIAESAFSDCDGLTSIVFGDGLTTIPEGAFVWCVNLTNVCLGSSIVNINDDAFYNCRKLREVRLPSTVHKMGSDVFYGCTNLVAITFEGDAPQSVRADTFSNVNDNCTAYVSEDSNGWGVDIPGKWKGINIAYWPCAHTLGTELQDEISPTCTEDGFSGNVVCLKCGAIISTGSAIPALGHQEGAGVVTKEPTTTEEGVMTYSCTRCGVVMRTEAIPKITPTWHIDGTGVLTGVDLNGVTEIVIPGDVSSIGAGVFSNCCELTSVTIPSSVTYIGNNAFYDCSNIVEVKIQDLKSWFNIEFYNALANPIAYGNAALKSGGVVVEDVVVPSETTEVQSFAFYGYKYLRSISIHDNVDYIGWSAFCYCDGMTNLNMGASVTTIDSYAFYHCEALNCLFQVPNALEWVGDAAFNGCRNLKGELHFPSSLWHIGDSAFRECAGFSGDLTISQGDYWVNIAHGSFYNCSNITGIVLSDTVRNIDSWAFRGCAGVSEIVIPDNVTNISDHAFVLCDAVTDLRIGRGVKSVGNYAFYMCESLTNIVFLGDAPEIGNNVFLSVDPSCVVKVPESSSGWDVDIPGTWNGLRIEYMQSYVVTYEPGSYISASTYTATKTGGVALTLRNATYSRTGYAQTAWSTSSAGTSRDYELGALYTADAAISLYPYWTANTYTVLYSLGGGAHGPAHPSSAAYDEAFYVSAPSKDGYTFAGWTVIDGLNAGTAKYGTTSSSQTTGITSAIQKCLGEATGDVWFKNLRSTTGSVTLNANWTGNVYRVTFDRQNGSGGSTYADVTYGAVMPTITKPTRANYDFCGYFTGADGSGTKYYNADGTSARLWDRTSATTLYAMWTPSGYADSVYTMVLDGVAWSFIVVNDSAIIYQGEGMPAIPASTSGKLVIPSVLGGFPVIGIGSDAFNNCFGLTEVTVPECVASIGDYAFADCDGLASVTIPNSVTNIGNCTFLHCLNLTNIVMKGNAPVVVGEYAFSGVHSTCVVKVPYGSSGWGVSIPGVWNGLRIEYLDCVHVAPSDGVSAPTIHINGGEAIVTEGEFAGMSCEVSITCATEGASIYYTTNGTTPRLTDRYRYTGAFVVTDTVTVKAIAVMGDLKSEYVTATIAKRALTLAEAAGAGDLTFTTGGDAVWTPIFDVTATSGLSVQSGTIGDEAETWIQTSVSGSGTFSFKWKVDCELDDSGDATWDRVVVSTNGIEAVRMDGTRGWEYVSFVFADAGTHTIRWTFLKDDYNDEVFADRAWVSGVTWTFNAPIPFVAADAGAETVDAAVDTVGFADSGVKAAIGGSAAEYAAFKSWAGSVAGGEAAVVANTNAAAAYLLGAERLFENMPTVEFGGVEVGTESGGLGVSRPTMTMSVTVKDGEEAVNCTAEKVKALFKATSDLGDWNGAAKLDPEVSIEATDDPAVMRFKVTPGDGTATRAFLQIRK